MAQWETSRDDGDTWQRVADQPRTINAGDNLRRSQLTLKNLGALEDGLLVQAVFVNAHGTTATDPVAVDVRTPGAGGR